MFANKLIRLPDALSCEALASLSGRLLLLSVLFWGGGWAAVGGGREKHDQLGSPWVYALCCALSYVSCSLLEVSALSYVAVCATSGLACQFWICPFFDAMYCFVATVKGQQLHCTSRSTLQVSGSHIC